MSGRATRRRGRQEDVVDDDDDDDDTEESAVLSSATTVDVRLIFPPGKIKSELRKEEDIGRLTKTAVDLVTACSAVFIRRLALAAQQEAVDDDGHDDHATVTLEHVRTSVRHTPDLYDFLDGTAWEDVKEVRAATPRRPTRRPTRKRAAPTARTTTKRASVATLCAKGGGAAPMLGLESTVTDVLTAEAAHDDDGGGLVEDTDEYD